MPANRNTPRAIAEQIAAALFVNVRQERAQRLVLTIDTPHQRDLGGWSERSVVNLIVAILAKEQG